MIIIEDAEMSGVNPFYPLLSRKNQPVRIADWEHYNTALLPFTLIGFILCFYGIAMMTSQFYSDQRFKFFGFACLCLAFARTIRVGKTKKTYISQAVSIRKTSPLADIEFAVSFATFGIGCLIILTNGASEYAEYAEAAYVLASMSFLFAFIPILNTIALAFGIVKIR